MSEFKEFADAMSAANKKIDGLAAAVQSAASVVAVQGRKLSDYWVPRVADAERALAAAVAGRDACQAKIDAAQREHAEALAAHDATAARVAEVKRQARAVIEEAEASLPAE
jgi:hypothetical protein